MKKQFFVVLIFSLTTSINSQVFAQITQYFNVKGRVVDQETKETLPFANLQLKNNSIGTNTNEKGDFSFNIPFSSSVQTLLVSYIGYQTFSMELSDKEDGYLLIRLKPYPVELEEVVIKPIDPVVLLKKAVDKIPQNHIPDSLLSTSYFRYLVKQDSLPIHLEEFVFRSYKAPDTNKEAWERVQGRYIKDDEYAITPGNTRFRAGVPNLLHGVNIFTTFFFRSPKYIISNKDYKNYTFELVDIITYQDRKVYFIEFDQNDKVKKSLFKGEIYLDVETLAFVSIQSQVSPKGRKYISKSIRYNGGYWIEEENNSANYRLVKGKWYLNDLSLYLKAYNFQGNYFTEVHADCMVNELQTENMVPIKTDLKALKKETEAWELKAIDEFWNSYNYMKMSDDWISMAKNMYIRNLKWEQKKKSKKIVEIDESLLLDEKYAIEDFMQKIHLNGEFDGSILIAKKGKELYKNAFGLADVDKHILNRTSNKFITYSISKAFTALRIFQLVQEGKLRLDDPFMKYFPDYSFPEGEKITIQELLTHTSGIPDFVSSTFIRQDESFKEQLFMESLLKNKLEFEPGTQFKYANSTYILLSFLIEKVTGKSFLENLEQGVFQKVNMKNSGVKEFGQSVQGLSKSYFKTSTNPSSYRIDLTDPGLFKGAGAVYSTPDDMLRWSNAIYQNKLLPKELQEQMFMSTTFQNRYAHGWSLCEIPTVGKFRGHIGGKGETLYSVFYQEENNNYTVILLSNTGFTYESMNSIVNAVFQILSQKKCPDFLFDELISLE